MKKLFIRIVSALFCTITMMTSFASCNTPYSNLTYIAFGDSITNASAWKITYPEIVSSLLGLKGYENRGESGSTLCIEPNSEYGCISSNVLKNKEKYDIISVLGGVNDYRRSLPLGSISDDGQDTIYGALNVMASYLTEQFSDSFIFFMTPYPCLYNGEFCSANNERGYNLQAVAQAVIDVCERYAIPYLDLYTTGGFEEEMYDKNSDGLHPSQRFLREVTAPQVAEFIKANYPLEK